MRRKPLVVLIAAVVFLMSAAPLFAHHGSAAFDTTKPQTVKGTVTEWIWANPHCFLKFDVSDTSGNIARWVGEVSNPPDMLQLGWSKRTFMPGDQITVTLLQAKNGNPTGRIQKVVLPDGRILTGMQGTGAFPGNNSKPPDNPKP